MGVEFESADNPGVVVWPPLLFAGVVGVVLALDGWMPLPLPMLSGSVAGAIGTVLLAAGGGLDAAGLWTMRRAGTHVSPSRPATALVVSGPFRFSRNPLYVGIFVLFIGMAFAKDTLWALIVLVPLALVVHYGVVLREERYLEAKFGEDYRAYCRAVRRYL